MLLYAFLIFLISAVGGLFMAIRILNGQLAPWAVSLIHAALGAVGLGMTALAVLGGAGGPFLGPMTLLTLLTAALGGFWMAGLHLKKRLASSGLVILHACVAIMGVLFLLGIAFLFDTMTDSMTADPQHLAR